MEFRHGDIPEVKFRIFRNYCRERRARRGSGRGVGGGYRKVIKLIRGTNRLLKGRRVSQSQISQFAPNLFGVVYVL